MVTRQVRYEKRQGVRDYTLKLAYYAKSCSESDWAATDQRWAWTGSGMDILQDTSNFVRWGYLFLKKNGSGYWFDFCNEIFLSESEWFQMSQMIVAVFSLLWFLYCQFVLHSSQSVIIHVTLSLIFSSEVEVVSCCYSLLLYAALFVVLNSMCVLCTRLIVYFMGGQLVFD